MIKINFEGAILLYHGHINYPKVIPEIMEIDVVITYTSTWSCVARFQTLMVASDDPLTTIGP